MLTRAAKRACTRFIETIKTSGTYIAISLLVISRIGSAAFGQGKFVGWAVKKEDGLKHPLGMSLALVAMISTGVGFYVNRVRALARNPALEEKALAIENKRKPKDSKPKRLATFCHPANHPKSSSYVCFQGVDLTYGILTAMTAFLSFDTLMNILHLFLKWFHSSAHVDLMAECKNEGDVHRAMTILWVGYTIMGSVNFFSFYKFNLRNLRNYYEKLFIEGDIKKLSYLKRLEVIISGLISSATVYFTMMHVQTDVVNRKGLCHVNMELTRGIEMIVCYIFAFTNFCVQSQMTLGAQLKKLEKHHVESIDSALNRAPYFNPCRRTLFRIAIIGESIASALTTYVAIATLPKNAANRPDLIYHPVTLAFATAGSLFILRTLVLTGLESFRLEVVATGNEIQHRRVIDHHNIVELGTIKTNMSDAHLDEFFGVKEFKGDLIEQAPPEVVVDSAYVQNNLSVSLLANDSLHGSAHRFFHPQQPSLPSIEEGSYEPPVLPPPKPTRGMDMPD